MVVSGPPSIFPFTAPADWEMTPLCVFCPVTMAVMPAAESVTICDAVAVSDRAMNGIRWMNRWRGSPYPKRLAAATVDVPPAASQKEDDVARV